MTILSRKEREHRRETIQAALRTDTVIDAVMELVEAHQDAWDINDNDAPR